MDNILQKLLNDEALKGLVIQRINEFRNISRTELFDELCFCLLTANYSAEKAIRIQKEVKEGFSVLSKEELSNKLKRLGYRYPNVRALYIVEARRHDLVKVLSEFNGNELREWLVKNVKGLGYKEASHFLRNIGYDDFAIIDFHIIDILVRNNLIDRPNVLTRKEYMEIENLLREISVRHDLTLAELDLYLWYHETGRILK